MRCFKVNAMSSWTMLYSGSVQPSWWIRLWMSPPWHGSGPFLRRRTGPSWWSWISQNPPGRGGARGPAPHSLSCTTWSSTSALGCGWTWRFDDVSYVYLYILYMLYLYILLKCLFLSLNRAPLRETISLGINQVIWISYVMLFCNVNI